MNSYHRHVQFSLCLLLLQLLLTRSHNNTLCAYATHVSMRFPNTRVRNHIGHRTHRNHIEAYDRLLIIANKTGNRKFAYLPGVVFAHKKTEIAWTIVPYL